MIFTNAIVRTPATNFSDGLTTRTDCAPDVGKALEQHAAYCRALAACGLEVTVMPADARYPDGAFVEDTFVIAERVAIATRPGAPTRMGEVASVAATLQRFRPHWEQIQSPGTVDGGDVCQVDEHFLIGVSNRTNVQGATQLANILVRHGYTASTFDIRGQSSLLHLKSGVTYLGERRFVTAPGFPTIVEFSDCARIEVAPAEAYAANGIRVNDEILIAAGFPAIAISLERLGHRVRLLDMSEFAKMDGGLSCLSLRF